MTAPHRLRWSTARDCPRKAVYEATAAPHRERTHREDRILWRGRGVGHEYVIAIAHESRRTVHVCTGPDFMLPYPDLRATSREAAGILAEMPVEWELGVGHADAYIVEAETILEVVSTLSPTDTLIHSKLVQGGAYAKWHGAKAVCVAIVNPSTLEDDRVVVVEGTDEWDGLMQDVDEIVRQLHEWKTAGDMPGRVCLQPGDAWGHFCTFAVHCFADEPAWSPETVADLDSPEALRLAIELGHVKTLRRELARQDANFEHEQKEIQRALADHVPEGKWTVAGGYEVKRSTRSGRQTFDYVRAGRDGRLPDSLLAEFTKTGGSFEVWDVKKVGEPQLAPDTDEEVPF